MNYALHPEAFNDLSDIWEFIAKDNLDAADRVGEEIYDAIRFLADHPHTGHRRTDITRQPLRFQRVYNYLIAYIAEQTPLLILAVIHGKRSPRMMASILRARQ
jgi:antitoxin ParD1/3/4